MANLQLNVGEEIIGSGMAVYWERWGLYSSITCDGYIYVTNQRVIFNSLLSNSTLVEIPLSEITKFWTSKHFFVTMYITLCDKNEKTFKFSGFKTKKMVEWLQQLGIPKV